MGIAEPRRIADYGLIGNCRTAALVSTEGSLDWCCLPKFDSRSYFARLLDPAGGHFRISPRGAFRAHQTYEGGTNVLQTLFTASSGTARLLDFFSVGVPDPTPGEEILRILEVNEGELDCELHFAPKGAYGRHALPLRFLGDWGIQGDCGKDRLLLQTTLPRSAFRLEETPTGREARAGFKLLRGERAIFSLTFSDESPAVMPPLELALERREQTARYWKGWSDRCRYEGPYRDLVVRSALTLKLLHFAPSGAFIAAPTTSLPENPGGSRNWDYRFCWLRDAAFTTRALLSLGYEDEATAFVNWLLHSTRLSWPELQVVYSVYGEARIRESTADWLAGFAHSRPVRLGNEASTQLQLDVYGEVVDAFHALSEHLPHIDRETRKMVIGFGKAVAKLWKRPDQGIWEFRSSPKPFTHSKLMCWVAMDRLQKLARRHHWRLPYDAGRIATEIRTEIEEKAFSPDLEAYLGVFGEKSPDASLLVMPLVGYCDARSPRFQGTLDRVVGKLGRNGFLYRYPPGSDGLPEPEGAFLICSFWLAEALAHAGRPEEARDYFEAVTGRLSTAGLASEEIDPDSRELVGNYPQGFSHIGLINAALAIDAASRSGTTPARRHSA